MLAEESRVLMTPVLFTTKVRERGERRAGDWCKDHFVSAPAMRMVERLRNQVSVAPQGQRAISLWQDGSGSARKGSVSCRLSASPGLGAARAG